MCMRNWTKIRRRLKIKSNPITSEPASAFWLIPKLGIESPEADSFGAVEDNAPHFPPECLVISVSENDGHIRRGF